MFNLYGEWLIEYKGCSFELVLKFEFVRREILKLVRKYMMVITGGLSKVTQISV